MVARSSAKKSHTGKDHTQQHETVTSAARISMALRPLMEKHAIITATLPDSNQFFNTALLSIDIQKNTITIDGLHPEKGHALFLQTERLTLHSTYDGIDLSFTTTLKRADSEDGMAFYVLDFPERIRYLQRRSAFRVPVSAAKEIIVEVETGEKKIFTGKLSDISVGGMCIRFSKIKELDLSRHTVGTLCCIHFPNNRKIRCLFKACHSNFVETSNNLHICGSFENLDNSQRRTIERFVIELQRMARKTLSS